MLQTRTWLIHLYLCAWCCSRTVRSDDCSVAGHNNCGFQLCSSGNCSEDWCNWTPNGWTMHRNGSNFMVVLSDSVTAGSLESRSVCSTRGRTMCLTFVSYFEQEKKVELRVHIRNADTKETSKVWSLHRSTAGEYYSRVPLHTDFDYSVVIEAVRQSQSSGELYIDDIGFQDVCNPAPSNARIPKIYSKLKKSKAKREVTNTTLPISTTTTTIAATRSTSMTTTTITTRPSATTTTTITTKPSATTTTTITIQISWRTKTSSWATTTPTTIAISTMTTKIKPPPTATSSSTRPSTGQYSVSSTVTKTSTLLNTTTTTTPDANRTAATSTAMVTEISVGKPHKSTEDTESSVNVGAIVGPIIAAIVIATSISVVLILYRRNKLHPVKTCFMNEEPKDTFRLGTAVNVAYNRDSGGREESVIVGSHEYANRPNALTETSADYYDVIGNEGSPQQSTTEDVYAQVNKSKGGETRRSQPTDSVYELAKAI